MAKKNGKTWQRYKGCFGGSLPNDIKSISLRGRSRVIDNSVLFKGTTGSKLSDKYSKRSIS